MNMKYKRKWIKTMMMGLLMLHCPSFTNTATAQTGTWKAYMAYSEVQQILKVGNTLYVRASNDLYTYNLNDHSITTYDKVAALSDNGIEYIVWNQQAHRLLIVYQNSDMDLMDQNGNVTNLGSLYLKSMMYDKTVNNYFVSGVYVYLATGFGVVKVNMERMEISESAILDTDIQAVAISGQRIYARTAGGTVLSGLLSDNLQDPHNWTATDNVPEGLFDQDTSVWDQYIDLVKSLKPGGPTYNYFNRMSFSDGYLFTIGGGWRGDNSNFNRPGCAQILDKETQEWTVIHNVQPLSGRSFSDVTAIAIDPKNKNHIFLSTCGTGLYEFLDGQLVKNYTVGNSPLTSALDSAAHPRSWLSYVRVAGLAFDNDGKLWMSCSAEVTKKDILLRLDPNTGKWTTYNDTKLYHNGNPLYILQNSMKDRNGYIWMANEHWDYPCIIRINPETEELVRYDRFINEDATSYTLNYIRCIAEDLEGNVWIGTDQGLFMYTPEQQADHTLGFTQIKVPRNDGTNYADYLMAGVDISCMAIDGANRKWLGTDGNGLYLISADNMEQLAHYTTQNSSLLSDYIESLAIDMEAGEVYIGTGQGLCSYNTDATSAASDLVKENVYAYPNPVQPNYTGQITVVGLTFDADVKILNTSGRLVAQGRSNGGTFTWDGCDGSGRRVASGIYMVAIAKSNGDKGVVCKIAIVN